MSLSRAVDARWHVRVFAVINTVEQFDVRSVSARRSQLTIDFLPFGITSRPSLVCITCLLQFCDFRFSAINEWYHVPFVGTSTVRNSTANAFIAYRYNHLKFSYRQLCWTWLRCVSA